MEIFICVVIFFLKIIENSLGTLRIIVIANGKKLLGAFLQAFISIIWVISAGAAIIDFKRFPIRIIAFSLGSALGSYLGSFIEQKIAMGNNILTVILKGNLSNKIVDQIRASGYHVFEVDTFDKYQKRKLLLIVVPRKKRKDVVSIIKRLDVDSFIIAGNAFTIQSN